MEYLIQLNLIIQIDKKINNYDIKTVKKILKF